MTKHHIYAEPRTNGYRHWDWWVSCGLCLGLERMPTWDAATWYLDLHLRVTHAES